MKIVFSVNYRTNWGENLVLTGNIAHLGSNNIDTSVPMKLLGTDKWTAKIDIPANTPDFEYSYAIRRDDGSSKHEWGHPHHFYMPKDAGHAIYVNDRWQDQPWDKPYYSSAIAD